MRRTRDRRRCPGGHALAPHGAGTAPGNTGRIRPAGPGGMGTLADGPEHHRTRRSDAGRSRHRRNPAEGRSRDGRPPVPRRRPHLPKGGIGPAAGGRSRGLAAALAPGHRPEGGRPGKNKDVASTTRLSVPTTRLARGTRRPSEPDPHPRGRFGPRSDRPARPVRTPGRGHEPDEHRVRFDAFALPGTIIGGFLGRATIMLKSKAIFCA